MHGDHEFRCFEALLRRSSQDQLALLLVVSRALQHDQPAEELPDKPDAELLHHCLRLHEIHAAFNLAFELVADDRERDFVNRPLDANWFSLRDRLVRLEGPSTLDGARAAALVLLDQYPGGVDEQDDLASWLAVKCAEYLVYHTGSQADCCPGFP